VVHDAARVRGAVEGWVMGRREAARAAVSGKSLARPCGAGPPIEYRQVARSSARNVGIPNAAPSGRPDRRR
jgi:hypothetical protein